MRTIHFMNYSGDRELRFDETPEGRHNRAWAREEFDHAMRSGSFAFKVDRADGKPDELVRHFDELENRTIVMPAIVAG